MIRVTHVITGLQQGGAETVLLRLLQRLDPTRFRMSVVSLSGEGRLSPDVRGLGIPVHNLHWKGFAGVPAAVARCAALLRNDAPDIVQTWMYHGDLIGGIAARIAGIRAIVWGLHAGTLPPPHNRSARAGIKLAARLSRRIPRKIVCCSHSARSIHMAAGYDGSKMLVIENGFEISHIPATTRESIRAEFGAGPGTPVITRVARFHPQKDYPCFVRACGLIHRAHPEAIFVMVGTGIDPRNKDLMETIHAEGIAERVQLLGPRDDVDAIYAGSDVVVSSSRYGEALPLAVGEGMAVGVPVVTTDVGDSARLVADPSRVTPPGDPHGLGTAIVRLLDAGPEERRARGALDRERIKTSYGLQAMADKYLGLYEELATGDRE